VEKFNRAVRLHHIERLKHKRKNYWGYGRNNGYSWENVRMTEQQLGKVVQYPQACSCGGCGNQRYWLGQSLTELCQMATLQEEIMQM
jgi:hypothetical protein